MALRSGRRLPKKFRRRASPVARYVARSTYATKDRRTRKRKERIARLTRRLTQFSSVVASEFRLWLIIGTLAVILAVTLLLLFAPLFDVRQINVRRQDARIDPEEVQTVLAPFFRRRLVLVTRGEIRSTLQSVYPDIAHVEISKEYPSTLTVTITLEPIVAAIAIDETAGGRSTTESGALLIGSGSLRYNYITERGILVSSPVNVSSQPLQTITITDWTIRPQERTLLLRPQYLKEIFLARDILRRDFGLESRKIVVYLRAQEFHITTQKIALWFDLRTDLPVQFERFRMFLKTLSLDLVKEYIDLRIAKKVVYK